MQTCKGCTRRAVGCHSTCKDYLEYKTEVKRVADIKRLEREATAYMSERNKTVVAYYAVREGGTPK